MTTDSREAVLKVLREEFQREWVSDFALLRGIPSTSVRKFLDYFAALDNWEKNALADGLAQCALSFTNPSQAHPYQTGNAAYKRYVDAMPLMWDWKYEGVRELRMRLAVAKLEPGSSMALSMTPDIKRWIESMAPVKSTEIRKVVKLALSQILGSMKISHERPLWVYNGDLEGRVVSVVIDYSHKYHQLEYAVLPAGQETQPWFQGLSYEKLMGLSFAHWDCLQQANLDQSVALLKGLITHCAALTQQLSCQNE